MSADLVDFTICNCAPQFLLMLVSIFHHCGHLYYLAVRLFALNVPLLHGLSLIVPFLQCFICRVPNVGSMGCVETYFIILFIELADESDRR